ncbi:hypothetical protein C8046_06015 [Serinibacter arcticus]|uniref:Uncharacterized protein n=1 Tax=Serinibacter arcticus TaxID=1655435 RepID=A0A2U1ZTH0_9MICO|nr:hypothetical protein [Serinibacter arcticus]PWD50285.1 hypothetical protein C8046_06015 [Serinibacter arcticus]
MSGGGGPLGLPGRRERVVLEVGRATRAWVLRLVALLAGLGATALIGETTAGLVLGALAAVALAAVPRAIGAAALLAVSATVLLVGEPRDPLTLAGTVLGTHLAIVAARLAEGLPLRGIVALAVLRERAPTLLLAQGVGQACALAAFAVRSTGAVLPWVTVGALAAVTALAWWLLRSVPQD